MSGVARAPDSAGPWWSWRLLGLWVVLNLSAFAVIVVGGVALEQLASDETKDLAENHRVLAVLIVALIGGAFQGFVLGRLQWRILRRRMPDLPARRWVIATFVPALLVWLLTIAPGAVDTQVSGGDTLAAFKNGFIQALVFGPLIGLSQARAIRDDTTRWKWWFVAKRHDLALRCCLLGARQVAVGLAVLAQRHSPRLPRLGVLRPRRVDVMGHRT